MRLFLMGMHMRSPIIMESITLPCLRILQGLIKQDLVTFLGKKRVSDCLALKEFVLKYLLSVVNK